MAKPRIALFGLTGLGTEALRSLVQQGFAPELVATRFETAPYPYHDEVHMADLAKSLKIPVFDGPAGEKQLIDLKPDLLLVCTYHRILKESALSSAAQKVNFHPSLLPSYRGASPYFWVLRNQESTTGVTAHLITPQVDQGDIVAQEEIAISPDETQGSLRKKLAALTGKMAVKVALKWKPAGFAAVALKENQRPISQWPRFTADDEIVSLDQSFERLHAHLRALLPWPGARLGEYRVGRILSHARVEDQTVALSTTGKTLQLRHSGHLLELEKI